MSEAHYLAGEYPARRQLLTTEQVIADEQATIAALGPVGLDARYLMGNAAQACFDQLVQLYPNTKRYWIFCGKGNNGGDGLALGWLLAAQGIEVRVSLCLHKDPNQPSYSHPALHYYQALQSVAGDSTLVQMDSFEHWYDPAAPRPGHLKGTVIVDAILGTGFRPPTPAGPSQLFAFINATAEEKKLPVVSLDVPSGVSGNGAFEADKYIYPEVIFSFHSFKPGQFIAEIQNKLQRVYALPIGIANSQGRSTKQPEEKMGSATFSAHTRFHYPTQAFYSKLQSMAVDFFSRPAQGHKYSNGAAILAAGGSQTEGAFQLAARAFFSLGGGILSAPCLDAELYNARIEREPHILHSSPTDFLAALPTLANKYHTLCAGPGWTGQEGGSFFSNLLTGLAKILDQSDQGASPKESIRLQTIILDAGALHFLPQHRQTIRGLAQRYRIVLLPHSGEFSRLCQSTRDTDSPGEGHMYAEAQALCAAYNCYLVLKGPNTFLFCPPGESLGPAAAVWPYTGGNSAVAGSGDALAGMLMLTYSRPAHPDILDRLQHAWPDCSEADAHIIGGFWLAHWIQARLSALGHKSPGEWLDILAGDDFWQRAP